MCIRVITSKDTVAFAKILLKYIKFKCNVNKIFIFLLIGIFESDVIVLLYFFGLHSNWLEAQKAKTKTSQHFKLCMTVKLLI